MGGDPADLPQSHPGSHRLWRQFSSEITIPFFPMSKAESTEQTTQNIFPTKGKLLALDVGLARIGIALCDPLRLRARPHSTLTRTSRNDDFAQLANIVKAEEVVGVVCGLPLNMDGSAGPQAQSTRKWAMRLAQAL